MKRFSFAILVSLALGSLVCLPFVLDADDVQNIEEARVQATRLLRQGNSKDALELFRKLLNTKGNAGTPLANDLGSAFQCLNQLGKQSWFDEVVEKAIDAHRKDWRLLKKAADLYQQVNHYGFVVAGKYERGQSRNRGKRAHSLFRDRVRSLQLYDQARRLSADDANRQEVAELHRRYAHALLTATGYRESWRLQALTDLEDLPDVEEFDGWWYYQPRNTGAPVDAEGTPVYHRVPATFAQAKSDGERWRWLLEEAARLNPNRAAEMKSYFASFLRTEFGVQTMAYYGWNRRSSSNDESGTYALHTLTDNETIARTAAGIKRIALPDEFNFIRIFKEIAKTRNSAQSEGARDILAQVYENRRQYPKAATAWREAIIHHGKGYNNHRLQRLEQIIKNWGRFEPARTTPAGRGAVVDYRFRNGSKVSFEAFPIDVPSLLNDVKSYIKSKPARVDYQQINIADIGYRLVTKNQTKYLGKRVAQWDMKLKPRPKHVDDRVTVTTPLSQAGAYLVVARMEDGNESRIVLWVDDTVIVRKSLHQQMMYYLGDAEDGHAIGKANVEFFGWRQEHIRNTKNYQVLIDNFSEFTDKQGLVTLKRKPDINRYSWLVMARKGDRFAYLGFDRIWFNNRYDPEYSRTKVFTVTDRPVYRPGQKVQYKFWIRHARYDQQDESNFANRDFTVIISNPKGQHVATKRLKSDDYGGLAGEFELSKDAQLGVYHASVINHGGGTFRVEEYKKPEFEVSIDAPSKPVKLGDRITAKIKAKYYFGAAVTRAKVKYKVLRTDHDSRWYPYSRWDWLYGQGYWWFGHDYPWYPGWYKWGCEAPTPWWLGAGFHPPEVVLENETEIGEDGTVFVEIDTQLAKELHGDQDHRYQIVAEVVDQSRRTIVGQGSVLVAKEPFRVFAWGDRGHYRTGDAVTASFHAHTLDSKPVHGTGELTLFAISYNDDGVPVEKAVETWKTDPNAEGRARQQFKAGAPGQYRISYKLTDENDNTMEGAYLFVVMGRDFDGKEYRFNDLELTADKKEYKAGETVRLLVNTDKVDSTVLLFLRPTNGVYLPPRVIKLDGKSFVEEIPVGPKDMPNFFVEAVTIANARVHTEMKEIVVPPAKRVVSVDIVPNQKKYKPGEKASVNVKLTDHNGKPCVGSTVLSVYDRSVEYISGGSNVPNIKEFFWKWRRHHYPQTRSSANHYSVNLLKQGQIGMGDIGVHGRGVVEEFGQQQGQGQGRRDNAKYNYANSKKGKDSFGDDDIAGGKADVAESKQLTSAERDNGQSEALGNTGGNLAETKVRQNFADTAFWSGAVTTDEKGLAEVSFQMPENLTGWKIRAWSVGHGTRVGEGASEVVTFKNLLLRLQAPRFFVQKDEVVLSANVHNYLEADKTVHVGLELDGGCLEPMSGNSVQVVTIPANGETRVDWRVKVTKEGKATVRMRALTDEESDAMQMTFPCFVHGMLKTDSFSGVVRDDDNAKKIKIRIPNERRPEESRLEIRYSPTLAGAMVDALPYLVDYPYGCTEQTLNRFVPTVITQNILQRMNLDLKAIRQHRTNLNAQEIGEDKQRKARWGQRHSWRSNPVFDEDRVTDMVKTGVKRLTAMQLSDGGWGWFSGHGEHSYPHTTAVVVHGLQTAAKNDVAIVPGVLNRGITWLKNYQDKQVLYLKNDAEKKNPRKTHADNIDALVFMILSDADILSHDMLEFLYRDRNQLSVYGKTLFGLALHQVGDKEKLAMLVKNIEQFLVYDPENQSAYLEMPENGFWWYWWGNDIETNAWYLKLLAATNPKSKQAAGVVKFLLNNRRHGYYWKSTRDTAYCIEAMADYLKATGENEPDMKIEIWIDGQRKKSVKVNKGNLFSFDNKLILEGNDVESGEHTIEVRRSGKGPVYFNAYSTNFTLEDFITQAGLEIKVSRKYYKLDKVDRKINAAGSRGQLVKQAVEKYERTEIENLSSVKSGDLIEVELEIESKNDYEYILFQDMKAAGVESVEVRSGYMTNSLGAYAEFRDNRVALFVRWLPRGRHSMSYRVRAEIPGKFSALPTRASAMYAPELRANSNELKFSIRD